MTTATKRKTIADRIAHLSPCAEARKWAAGYTSPEKAWAECQRGDWMLWIIGRLAGPPESDSRKTLVLCACECARLSLPIFEKRYPNDGRVRKCIETAERWAKGEATIAELRDASAAADADAYAYAYAAAAAAYYAYAAAAAAYYAYAAAAAAAAAYAAAAAAAAAAAVATATATAAAAATATAADADAARSATLAKCADIVRRHYPKPPRVTT